MEFLERMLHIRVKIDDHAPDPGFPNYILSRYTVKRAWFDRQGVILLYPKTELATVDAIKTHIAGIRAREALPVVTVLDRITSRERQRLIDAGIPFVVGEKQCYLPFMGTVLTERCDAQEMTSEKLTPSAQLLLLYYIDRRQSTMYAASAATALGVSAMTVTRAVRQLESAGLFTTRKAGATKIIESPYARQALFERARPMLMSPVRKRLYVERSGIPEGVPIAGEAALSERSMLNPPKMPCYAMGDVPAWAEDADDAPSDRARQAELQIWRYPPDALVRDRMVDPLSLALSFMDDPDERIEEAIEEMLKSYREATDGHGI